MRIFEAYNISSVKASTIFFRVQTIFSIVSDIAGSTRSLLCEDFHDLRGLLVGQLTAPMYIGAAGSHRNDCYNISYQNGILDRSVGTSSINTVTNLTAEIPDRDCGAPYSGYRSWRRREKLSFGRYRLVYW